MASDITNIGMSGLSSPVLDDKSGRKAASIASDVPLNESNQIRGTNKASETENSNLVNVSQSNAEKPKLEDVVNQVQSLQEISDMKGWSVNFAVDDESAETIIKVVDAETHEIIRQIPSEEMLSISKRIKSIQSGEESDTQLSGLLFDRKA